MDWRSVLRVWWRTIIDCVTLVILLVVFVGLYVAQLVGDIVRRGFYCNDSSIRFPAKQTTIPFEVLVVVGILLNLLAVIGGNVWERYVSRKSKPGKTFHPFGENSQKFIIPHWIVRICYELRWFFVGYLITLVITDTLKIVVGRLRPNFIDVCDPDFSQFNCTDQFGNPRYVLDYVCQGAKSAVDAARVSWPSLHSSLSAFSFLFLTLYVSCVRSFYPRSALKLMLMLFSFMLTMLTGVSRVTDNKHHPTDVLSGWIIGAGVAFVVVYYNLRYFGELKTESECNKPEDLTPIVSAEVSQYNPSEDTGDKNSSSA